MIEATSLVDSKISDAMRRDVRVVPPTMTLPEVERAFLEAEVSGFPVVDRGQLIGVVTRSDIVRQLCVEQSLAEMVSDYYLDLDDFAQDPRDALNAIGDRVGRRIERLRVGDVMRHKLLTVSPDAPLGVAAQLLLKHKVHRVLVTEAGQLVGILTAVDLVRFFAEREL